MNEPRVPIHPQPSFNDVRRLQDQLIQAGARLLPANEKLYEENIKLRKVVSILISEGRNKISDKLLAWGLRGRPLARKGPRARR